MLTSCGSFLQKKVNKGQFHGIGWRVLVRLEWSIKICKNLKPVCPESRSCHVGSVVPKLSCTLENLEDLLKTTVAWLPSPRLYGFNGTGCGLGIRIFKGFSGDLKCSNYQEPLSWLMLSDLLCTTSCERMHTFGEVSRSSKFPRICHLHQVTW